MTKEIIERHGGRISVQSDQTATTFQIFLPLAKKWGKIDTFICHVFATFLHQNNREVPLGFLYTRFIKKNK